MARDTLGDALSPWEPSGSKSGPIRVPKTAEVIANHIRARIVRGELGQGDFLPPESALLENFAISRPTLREAFRILEAERLISVVRGSRAGARIHQPQVEGVSRSAGFALQAQGTTVSDVYEARLAIEPYVVRRIAETQPEGAVERIKSEVEKFRVLVDEKQYEAFIRATGRFHRLLVELLDNQTLLLLTRMLADILERYERLFFSKQTLDPLQQEKLTVAGVRSFERLVELLEATDAAGAEEHWRKHVQNANKAWMIGMPGNTTIDVL